MKLKNTFYLSIGTITSRIVGFIRDILIASYFGTSYLTDAFYAAFQIPSLFRRILGEEMYERAIMPIYKNLYAKNQQTGQLYLKKISILIILLSFCCILIILPLLKTLIHYLYPGFDKITFNLTYTLSLILLPFILFISLGTFISAFLLYEKKYIIYSFAPVMINIIVIISILILGKQISISAISIGYTAGGFIFFICQLPFYLHFYKKKKLKTNTKEINYVLLKKSYNSSKNNSFQIFISSLINKSVEIVDKFVASLLSTGSITYLYYSFRIIQLPFAIISLAISRSTATELINLNNDKIKMKSYIQKGFNINLILLIPVIIFSILFSNEIITILFKRGNFNDNSVYNTATAFTFYLPGLLPMGLNSILLRIFSNFEKNKIPLITSSIGGIVNIILNFVLYKTFLKHAGIALATSISFTIQFFILKNYLDKIIVSIDYRKILKNFTIIIIISSIFFIYKFIFNIIPLNNLFIKFFTISIISFSNYSIVLKFIYKKL